MLIENEMNKKKQEQEKQREIERDVQA
jgi:hypothetical protein